MADEDIDINEGSEQNNDAPYVQEDKNKSKTPALVDERKVSPTPKLVDILNMPINLGDRYESDETKKGEATPFDVTGGSSLPGSSVTYTPLVNAGGSEIQKYKEAHGRPIENSVPIKASDADYTNDYAGMVMSGMTDNEIYESQVSTQGMSIGLSNLDEFVNNPKYIEYAASLGFDEKTWQDQVGPQMHEMAKQRYAGYSIGRYQASPYEERYGRYATDPLLDALQPTPLQQESFEGGLDTDFDTRWALDNTTGGVARIKSDEEFAVERNFYVPAWANKEGKHTGDLNWYLKNKYSWGDKNGDNLLRMEYDQVSGLPYMHEVSAYHDLKSSEILSVTGPQAMYEDWSTALWNSMVRNTIMKIPKVYADFATMGGNFEDLFYNEAKNNYNSWEYKRNISAWASAKPSWEAQNTGVFENSVAFATTAGNALGSLATMFATRAPMQAFAKGVTKTPGINRLLGLKNSASNIKKTGQVLTETGKHFINKSTLVPLSFVAASDMNDMMEEYNIPKEYRSMLFLPFAATTFLSEQVFGTAFENSALKIFGGSKHKEVLRPILDAVKASGLENNPQALKQAGKEYTSSIMKLISSGAKGVKKVGGVIPGVLRQPLEEGIEEVVEGRMQNGIMAIFDSARLSNDAGIFDKDRYTYYAERVPKNVVNDLLKSGKDVPGFMDKSFYKVDKLTGRSERVSYDTFKKGSNYENLKSGEGLFGVYDEENGISGTLGNIWDGAGEDAFFGAFATTFVSAFNRTGKKKHQDQLVYDAVIRGESEKMKAEVMELINAGHFGPSDLSENGQPLTQQEVANGTKSMNQVVGESMLKDIETAEELFNALKDADGNINRNLFTDLQKSGDNYYTALEALENLKTQKDLTEENQALETESISATDEGLKQANAKKMQENSSKLEDLSLQMQDILSGKRQKEKVVDNFIGLLREKDNSPLQITGVNGKSSITANNVKNFNDRFDKESAEFKQGVTESQKAQEDFVQRVPDIIKSIESLDITKEDDNILNTLKSLQDHISKFGANRSEVDKIRRAFEGKRQELRDEITKLIPEDFDETGEVDQAAYQKSTELGEQVEQISALEESVIGDDLFYKAQNMPIEELQGIVDQTNNQITTITDDTENEFGDENIAGLQRKRDFFSSILHDRTREQKMSGPNIVGGELQYVKASNGNTFIVGDVVSDKNDKSKSRYRVRSLDNDNAYLENKEEPVKLSDLLFVGAKAPAFVEGKLPSDFSLETAKDNFYASYVDGLGNNINIPSSISDLQSRKLNEEDSVTINNLEDAINNNLAFLKVNKSIKSDLMDKKFNIGQFTPSDESIVSDDDFTRIATNLSLMKYMLSDLKIRQGLDAADKKNRQNKLRANSIKIRHDISKIILTVPFESKSRDFIDLKQNENTKLIEELNQKYKDTNVYDQNSLQLINKNLLEIEDKLHELFNSKDGAKIIAGASEAFKAYKGMKKNKFSKYTSAFEFSIGSYDDIFSYDSFSEKRETPLTKDYQNSRETFSKLYFTNHLQTIKRLSPVVFYKHYNGMINTVSETEGVIPSWEQENQLQHTVSFLINPDNSSLIEMDKILFEPTNENSSKSISEQFAKNSLFVRGYAGTGKTTGLKNTFDLYNRISGKKANVSVSAPSPGLRSSISSNISEVRNNFSEASMDINGLMEFITQEKTGAKNTDIIIIDEVSNLSKPQLDDISLAIDSGIASGKLKPGIRLLMLGDQSQMTSIHIKQGEQMFMPAERMMERTMPITEVFRSGSADISNYQSAFRLSVFRNSTAILPKGTYDADRNNGLQYWTGSKEGMYDQYVDDINSGDLFKRTNTALIVFSKNDRLTAISYIKQRVTDPNVNLEESVKTIEEGEFSAQGLEFGRTYVAITPADAGILYNRAMLTAASRAVKTQEHDGYAFVMGPGISEEGQPLIVSTKTNSAEDIQSARNYYSFITGSQSTQYKPQDSTEKSGTTSKDSKGNTKTSETGKTEFSEITEEQFIGIKKALRSVSNKNNIEKVAGGFTDNGINYRYRIGGRPSMSVSERIKSVITYTNESPSNAEIDFTSFGLRGDIVHRVIESAIRAKQKKGGNIFTQEDIDYLKDTIMKYNVAVDNYNSQISEGQRKLTKINTIDGDSNAVLTNPFIKNAYDVALIMVNKFASNGNYSLPEQIVGNTSSLLAGTIDSFDIVGMDGGIPVIDIYDFKSMTPYNYDNYNGSPKYTGAIKSLNESLPYSKQNENLLQLAMYGAILENGDDSIGLPKFKIRNIIVAKMKVWHTGVIESMDESSYVTYDYNSDNFNKFREMAKDLIGISDETKEDKVYDKNNDLLEKTFVTPLKTGVFEITGVFTQGENDYVELNFEIDSPILMDEFKLNYSEKKKVEFERPSNDERMMFNSGAINFVGENKTYTSTFISAQEGNKEESPAVRIRAKLFKSFGPKMKAGAYPAIGVVFYNNIELTNQETGKLQTFNNVLVTEYAEENFGDIVKAMKQLSEFSEMTDAELIKEIKDKKYNVISVFAHADSGYSTSQKSIDSSIDLSNDGNVQKLLSEIQDGFLDSKGTPDAYALQNKLYHSHLLNLRSYGARKASETGEQKFYIGDAKVLSFGGKARVKYSGAERSVNSFMQDMNKKGVSFGTPYFDNNVYSVNNSDGTVTNVASMVVNAWYYGEDIDPVKVILKSERINDAYLDSLLKNLTNLKASKSISFNDIIKSPAYRFIQYNRSLLKTADNRNITEAIDGLSNYLNVDGAYIEINKGKYKESNVKEILENLEGAIKSIYDANKAGVPVAKQLFQMISFRKGDNGSLTIPDKELSKLRTTASNIMSPSMYVNSKILDVSNNNIQSNEDELPNNIFGDDVYFMEVEDGENISNTQISTDEEPIDIANKEDNKSYFGLVKRFFGDKFNLDKIRRTIANQIIQEYYNTDINKLQKSLRDSINDVYSKFQGKSADVISNGINIVEGLEDKGVKSFDDINGDNIHVLDNAQITQYAYWKVGADREVFDTFLKKILPNISLSDLRQRNTTEAMNESGDNNEDTYDQDDRNPDQSSKESQSRSMDELESKNFMDSISGVVRLQLENIPLNIYYKEKSGKIGYKATVGQFADFHVIKENLLVAAQSAFIGNTDQIGLDPMEVIGDNLLSIISQSKFVTQDANIERADATYNSLMTFYNKFFSPTPLSGSHYYLSRNWKSLIEQSPNKAKIIRGKAQVSSDLMSALYTHFGSIVTRNNLSVQATKNGFFQKTQANNTEQYISNELKKSFDNSMFDVVDNEIVISESIRSSISPETGEETFIVSLSGIKDNRHINPKTLIKTSLGTDKQSVTKFEIPEDVTINEIKDLLNLLGVKGLISNNALKSFMETREDNVNPVGKKLDRGTLAEIIGMFMFSVKSGINPNSNVFKTVDNFYRKNGYKKDALSELLAEVDSDIEEIAVDSESNLLPGEDFFKPSDLYRQIQNLAFSQAKYQAATNPDHTYNSLGKRIYKHLNGSTVFRLFSQDKVSGKHRSTNLKNLFKEGIENLTYEELQQNPYVVSYDDAGKEGITYLNPFLDPNSGYDVLDVYSADGILNDYSSVKVGKNMGESDYASFLISGLFINDIFNSEKAFESFKHVFHNPADKSNPVAFELTMAESRDEKAFTKTKDGISYNAKWRNENAVKLFKYYEKERVVSIRKWADFFKYLAGKAEYGISGIAGQEASDLISGEAMIRDVIQNALNQGTITAEQLSDEIRSSKILIKNNDYKIDVLTDEDSGQMAIEFNVGNSISMINNGQYRIKNLEKLNTILQSNEDLESQELNDFMNSIFNLDIKNFINYLKDIDFKFEESFNGDKAFTKQITTKEGKKYIPNPTLESFFYGWHFADSYLSTIVMGSPANYKDIADYFKRSAGAMAPGWLPDTDNKFGIGKNTNYVVMRDLETHSAFFDQIVNNTDGLGVMPKIAHSLWQNSTGGKGQSVMGDGMAKPVYFHNNLLTRDLKYHKYAILPLTDSILKQSSYMEDIFRKMVGENLYNKWIELGKNQDLLLDYVIDNNLNDSFIHLGIHESGVKAGISGSIDSNIDDYSPFVQQADNKFMQIQLNASQDLDETELSNPTQLLATIQVGEQNQEIGNKINRLKSLYANIAWEEIKSQFMDGTTISPRKFKNWVRSEIVRGVSNSGDVSKLAELANDSQVSLDIPTIRKAVLQYFSNRVTKDVVKPKWNGQRMSQAPGFFFDIVELEDGTPLMRTDAEKSGIKDAITRGLNPTKYYRNAEFTDEIVTKAEYLEYANSGAEVFVKNAEIIMPFSYFKQFGIQEDLMNNPDMTLNDIFIIRKADGNMINLRNIPNENLAQVITQSFEEEGLSGYILDRFKSSTEASTSKKGTVGAVMMDKGEQSLINQVGIVQAEAFIQNLKESLEVILDRIPTSSGSSAELGSVIGWIMDNGNTVYTSAEKNILDGSDYDIDQLNVYFKFVDETGNIISGEDTKEGIVNSMFDIISQYYTTSNNMSIFGDPIDLSDMGELTEDKIKKQTKFKRSFNSPGTNLYYYDKIVEGKSSVGVSANMNKSYSLLLNSVNNDPSISGFDLSLDGINPETGVYVIKYIEKLVNAATDNAKLMYLGILDIVKDSIPSVSAMFMQNYTMDDMVNFFDKEPIKRVFQRVKRSQKTRSFKRISVLESINFSIDNYVNPNKIEKRRDEMLTRLNERNDELKNQEILMFESGSTSYVYDERNDIYKDPITGEENIYAENIEYLKKQITEINTKFNSINQQLDLAKQNQGKPVESYASLMSEDLIDLLKLKDFALTGEAMNRLNTVIKMDSQGIPVFDYDFDKLIRDIEFSLNQSLGDFILGKEQTSPEWFMQRKKYMTESYEDRLVGKSKIERFKENEHDIRSRINISKFVRQNPFIMQNIVILSEMKAMMQSAFIRDSKLTNDVIDKYLDDKKQDWFNSEKHYYSFYKENQKFDTALFFATKFKNRRFESFAGIKKGEDIINVSTPEGRYDFGMGFGIYISDLLNKVRNTLEDQLSNDEIELKNNRFIRRLTATPTRTGNFVEIIDSYKLSKDDYADLAISFKKLPEDLKEKFYVYQLSKDDFEFKKGGLYEVLDNAIFREYSEFLNEIKDISDKYEIGQEPHLLTLSDSMGNDTSVDLFEQKKNVFLRDIGYYSENKILLPWYNSDWKKNQVPNQYKRTVKDNKSGYRRMGVYDDVDFEEGQSTAVEGKTKSTFNGYNVVESNMTQGQVIRSIPAKAYNDLMTGKIVSLTFNKKVSYHRGSAYIPNGRKVLITDTFGKSIKMKLLFEADSFDDMKTRSSKEDVLSIISKRGSTYMYRAYAGMIKDKPGINKVLKGGIVKYGDSTEIPDLLIQGRRIKGFINSAKNIYINSEEVTGQQEFEHTFLHEITHNLTTNALEMTAEEIAELEKSDPDLAKSIKDFQEDTGKLYDEALARSKDKTLSDEVRRLAFKTDKSRTVQLSEFIAVSMSNFEFQKWLHSNTGIEEIDDTRMTFYQRMVDAINRLFFGVNPDPESYSMLDQVIGVTTKFIMTDGYKAMNTKSDNSSYEMSERMSSLVNMYKGASNLPSTFESWSEADLIAYDDMVRKGKIIC